MPRLQAGAYLLETLVGILVFSVGILGIVALQAASLRSTSDAALRAEAVFAASQLIAQMWADDPTNLEANYSSALKGKAYLDFAARLKAAQGGAYYEDPDVVFDASPRSSTSTEVTIAVKWRIGADPNNPAATTQEGTMHSYTISAFIGRNQG